MTVAPGERLGPYEIDTQLGAGGMGVVFRARDPRLERDVALKILPEEFARHPERLARFEREARLLASLNHPNIAAIHGLEVAEGRPFLVLELVEGEDLARRIARGPVPAEEALAIARQIAEALEEAHEKGIVHRDLKPANVSLTPDGRVKVLDFGLAKAYAGDPVTGPASDLSQSPTLAATGTQMGVILGTAPYMSPEQARGRPVDRRADIWALGVVLYEMLTARQAFQGDTVSDTLAAILKQEPDWSALPPGLPPGVVRLLGRCLQKDPRSRLRDAGDARLEIAEAMAPGAGAPGGVEPRRRFSWAAAALGLAVGATLAITALVALRRTAPSAAAPVSRLAVRLPAEAPYGVRSYPGSSIAISRDGATIVYRDAKLGGLHVRRLDESEVRSIPGAEGGCNQPFFSPDGEWVAYFTDGALMKVPLNGGRPVTLVRDLPNASWLRGSWADDGSIVFDTWNAGLRVIPADGGEPRPLTRPESEWHLGPESLPGSDRVLYFAQTSTGFRIEAISLDGSGRRTVLENASHPHALASGHLLFVRDGGLMVSPFDLGALGVTGPAVPVPIEAMVDHVNVGAPLPQIAVSLNGTLVYAPARSAAQQQSTLVWVDPQGKVEELATVPFAWPHFQLSRDGSRLALAGRDRGLVRIAILDLARKTLTPLREETLDYPAMPVWSPDGERIFFSRFGTHEGEILSQAVDGASPQGLMKMPGTWLAPHSLSLDGRFLVFTIYHPETASDIWMLDLTASGGERAARPFLADAGNQWCPALSPDGQWLAYASVETGRNEIYLRRFPGGESKVRVSAEGGFAPLWSPDGRALFIQSDEGFQVTAVPIQTTPALRLGEPRRILDGVFAASSDMGRSFAVAPDGRRLLMVRQQGDQRTATEVIVIQNWFGEIERLAGAGTR